MKLKFTLWVYLTEKNGNFKTDIERRLRQCLSDCGVTIEIWNVYNTDLNAVNSVRNGKSKPTFGDLSYEVYCEALSKTHWNCNADVRGEYETFRKDWLWKVGRYFPEENKPLLNFKVEQAYCYVRRNQHSDVVLNSVSFGTLVTPTSYVEHHVPGRIPLSNTFLSSLSVGYNYCADFKHDTSELSVQIREQNKRLTFVNRLGQLRHQFFQTFKLNYANIKQILVNDTNVVIFELMNPPTLHNGIKRVVDTSTLPKDIIGRSNAICLKFSSQSEFEEIISRMHFRCKRNGTPIYFAPFTIREEAMPSLTSALKNPYLIGVDYSCVYLIEALIRRNCRLVFQEFQTFLQTVCQYWKANDKVTEEALSDLVRLTDTGHSYNYLSSFKVLYEWYLNLDKSRIELEAGSNKITKIRRAIVTPTRVLLWPPEICIQNRIIREFDKEHALRVSFRDEDYFKLNYRYADDNVIKNTIKPNMLHGITIGDRHFEFLAWSNSQIRDHGVWLYAKDAKGNTAASIRNWMGDFSHIRCVPKYMSRMGQCFSQTQDSGRMFELDRIQTVDDIERGHDPESGRPYCFSDGVGQISVPVAQKVIEKLDLEGNPSAFQIRFAGCKGMLVQNPQLKNYDVVFRRSMRKFESSSKSLEICKVSSAGPVNLNRPLITILNQNGIQNHVFLRLQEDALETLTDMFFNDAKAAHYLLGHQNLNLKLFDLAKSGISLTVEPFFRGMLLAAHLSAVDKILKKASLPIDPSKGRNMFGVLDEYGILQYGQVFVQYTKNLLGKETNSETKVLTGPVMVTKNPAYQGGDVRILTAVDIPQLRHIKDCIVFPQNGHRPHPNEMSGSDLDGDEYTVIWKEDLIFSPNKPPSHFPVPQNEQLLRPIEVRDMLDFLCDYVASDMIGMIATAHLCFADSVGIASQLCANIARKCSIAVDYAKNGQKVNLSDNEKPLRYPDFMQKGDKNTYKSKRSLGVLFRVVQTFCEYTVTTSETYSNITFDPYLEYNGWQKYKQSAIETRDKYNDRLETILMTYGIKNESEAMTNCFSKLHGRYNFYKDRSEIEELIKLSIEELAKIMRKDFLAEFENQSTPDTEDVLRKASAWYMVTYSQTNSPRFLSFPWILEKYLCQIKLLNLMAKNQSVPVNPVLVKFSLKLKDLKSELNALQYNVLRELQRVATPDCPLVEWELAAQMLDSWRTYNLDLTNACQLNQFKTAKLLIHAHNVSGLIKSDAITLILTFLRFFMSMRFKDKRFTREIVNTLQRHTEVHILKLNVLAKEAMTTYRHVAITGTFEAFGNFESNAAVTEMEEMEPYSLSGNAKGMYSVENLKLKLCQWSGCNEILIREDRYSLQVSAWGTTRQMHKLRGILNKGPEAIAKALANGATM